MNIPKAASSDHFRQKIATEIYPMAIFCVDKNN